MINAAFAVLALAASANAQYYNNGYGNYGMSNGARIGTGVGVAIAFLILLCLLLSCCMMVRRRRAAALAPGAGGPAMGTVNGQGYGGPGYGGPGYGPAPAVGGGFGNGKRFGFGRGGFGGRGGVTQPASAYQPGAGAYAPPSGAPPAYNV